MALSHLVFSAGRSETMMADPLFQFLDAVTIDDRREYIEFQFSDSAGETKAFQIDFAYIESLAALFQQAFLSATIEDPHGGNRSLGPDWVAVPRAPGQSRGRCHERQDRDDVLSRPTVPGLLCAHKENARALSQDLRTASEAVSGSAHRIMN
jgi:hypothetical protein